MVKKRRWLLAAAVFLLVLAACTSTPGRPGPGTGTTGTVAGSGSAAPGGLRAVRHVWVIELENQASLSGLLILAGVRAGYAVLATLAYRIASYWLPLLAGPPAYLLFRHRYGRPAPRRATPGEAGSTA